MVIRDTKIDCYADNVQKAVAMEIIGLFVCNIDSLIDYMGIGMKEVIPEV